MGHGKNVVPAVSGKVAYTFWKLRHGRKVSKQNFQCRRRRPDETVPELAQDIRRLMTLAYPGDRSSMAERLAKEHFLCAIDDQELELKVR